MRNIFLRALDALTGRVAPTPAEPPKPAPAPAPAPPPPRPRRRRAAAAEPAPARAGAKARRRRSRRRRSLPPRRAPPSGGSKACRQEPPPRPPRRRGEARRPPRRRRPRSPPPRRPRPRSLPPQKPRRRRRRRPRPRNRRREDGRGEEAGKTRQGRQAAAQEAAAAKTARGRQPAAAKKPAAKKPRREEARRQEAGRRRNRPEEGLDAPLRATSASSRQARSPAMATWPPWAPTGSPRQSVVSAAGAGDHRDRRVDVPGLQAGLDHQVDRARRHHGVGVGVAAQPGQPCGGAHRASRRSRSAPWKMAGSVVAISALGRARAGADLQRPAGRRGVIRREPPAWPMKSSPRKDWPIEPSTGLPSMAQADQGGPDRQAGDEGAGAVDRDRAPRRIPRPARSSPYSSPITPWSG